MTTTTTTTMDTTTTGDSDGGGCPRTKFRELKYEVVTATKVVGEHSPPYTCKGNDSPTMKAGNPTESIPKQKGEEGGFYLIWRVHGGFWVKK